MTMFENFFLTPWAPPAPKSPTLGAWPRRQNKNPVWYVLYLSFVRTHTKFGIKIFEIDFVIEIKWYLTFWPGAEKKFDVARPIHVSNSHTKFGWISSNGLRGDSITDRRMDERRRLQYPLRFFKKAWGQLHLNVIGVQFFRLQIWAEISHSLGLQKSTTYEIRLHEMLV